MKKLSTIPMLALFLVSLSSLSSCVEEEEEDIITSEKFPTKRSTTGSISLQVSSSDAKADDVNAFETVSFDYASISGSGDDQRIYIWTDAANTFQNSGPFYLIISANSANGGLTLLNTFQPSDAGPGAAHKISPGQNQIGVKGNFGYTVRASENTNASFTFDYTGTILTVNFSNVYFDYQGPSAEFITVSGRVTADFK